MCHQQLVTPASIAVQDDGDVGGRVVDGFKLFFDGFDLFHSFAIPATTSDLRQDVGEPGERGDLTIMIKMISMMISCRQSRSVTSSLDPEHRGSHCRRAGSVSGGIKTHSLFP